MLKFVVMTDKKNEGVFIHSFTAYKRLFKDVEKRYEEHLVEFRFTPKGLFWLNEIDSFLKFIKSLEVEFTVLWMLDE